MADVDTKSEVFKLRVATADLARWREAAGSRKLSAFVRDVVNEECAKTLAVAADEVRQERIEQLSAVAPGLERASTLGGPKPFRPDFKK